MMTAIWRSSNAKAKGAMGRQPECPELARWGFGMAFVAGAAARQVPEGGFRFNKNVFSPH